VLGSMDGSRDMCCRTCSRYASDAECFFMIVHMRPSAARGDQGRHCFRLQLNVRTSALFSGMTASGFRDSPAGSCDDKGGSARPCEWDMTKCVKPLSHLATSSTKSSKWSVLIGRAGRLRTKSL